MDDSKALQLKIDELSDRIDDLRLAREVADGYRQHAERERDQALSRFDACEDLIAAVRHLIHSGYDGPFMGDEVAELFEAFRKLEVLERDGATTPR